MNNLPPPPPDLVRALAEPRDPTQTKLWWAGPEFFKPFKFGAIPMHHYLMTVYPEIDHLASFHSQTVTHLGERRTVVSSVVFKDGSKVGLNTIEGVEQVIKDTWLGVEATSQRGDGRIKDTLALRLNKPCQPNTDDQ